ncbi:TPA: glycosyltransferase family 4 protein [Streptococcus suis]
MTKKIAFLIYDTSLIGGAEKISIDLANQLNSEYETHIISLFQSNPNSFFQVSENTNHFIISKTTKSITLNILFFSAKLRKYIKDNGIEVLISVTPGVVGVSSISIMGLNGISHIFWEHSNLENQTYGQKHFFRQYLGSKFADKVVVLTERDMHNYMSKLSVSKNKIKVIHNYFDNSNSEILNSVKYDKNSNLIVSIGRLTPIKGFDRLLDVAEILKEVNDDWQWHIYGDGEQRDFLLSQIEKKGLQEKVILKGTVSNVYEILPYYSICVMTSYYEGLPLSLLEAKRCRIPIVAFDCATGPGEIIRDNIDGYLVENGNKTMMVNRIKVLLEDQKKRESFSEKSQENLHYFSKNNILEEWKILINQL